MDNLTHSLIGAATAEVVFQRSPSARKSVGPAVRTLFWFVSIAGNNLPDLDVLYAGFLLNGRLGYLLHHRGHTHTALLALVLGALTAWGAQAWFNRKRRKLGQWDLRALWALALAGPLVHLGPDGMDNYGIHPFWPFWGGWVYGDTLFIIEPLLWMALFPIVYFSTNRRAFRWACETLLVALFTAVWILPITRWYSAAAIGVCGVGMWFATRRTKPRLRADLCSGLALLVMGVFWCSGWYARREVRAAFSETAPASRLHDVILTPFPSNPFCWNIITVETLNDGSRYRLRRGRFSPWPRIVAADQCPHFPTAGSTALLSPVPEMYGKEFEWEGQYQAAVGDLKDYTDYSCTWSAFLKFARAPFLQEEGQSIWAGDLRFDYGPELGFAEMEAPEKEPPCPSTPGWIPPRAFLF